MEPRSGPHGKPTPRCIVNYNTSRRSAIDAYQRSEQAAGRVCVHPISDSLQALDMTEIRRHHYIDIILLSLATLLLELALTRILSVSKGAAWSQIRAKNGEGGHS